MKTPERAFALSPPGNGGRNIGKLMPEPTPPEDTALASHSATLEVGLRVFRQYVLKRFLGRSTLGASWLVVHEGIGRELTMRFVPGAWIRDDRIMGRLRETVGRLLEITHPGLVGLLDFARDPSAAAVVSKFVDSETALDARARRPQRCFDVDDLRPWLIQAAEALDFAWRQHQATHGDLSPSNLLITPVGDVKIADFGLARALFDFSGSKGGPLLEIHPAFSSPQRAAGGPATVTDDVYAFGATVYDLLSGKPPFYQGDVRRQIENTAPPSMAQRRLELGLGGDPIPAEWEAVIAACLAKRPEDRPKSVREAAERLGLLLPLSPSMAQPWQPTVLPRPHETVVGYRVTSLVSKPTTPVPQYPSTLGTEPMEAATSRGDAPPTEPPPLPEPVAAVPDPAPTPADELIARIEAGEVEAPPATVDESLDFEGGSSGGYEPLEPIVPPTTFGRPAGSNQPARFIPPPPSKPAEPDEMATMAAEEPPASIAPSMEYAPASEPVKAVEEKEEDYDVTMAATPGPFIPPPPSHPQPIEDDGMGTLAAEDSAAVTPPPLPVAAPPSLPAAEEEHDVTLAATPARFVPPPVPGPTADDSMDTYAAEEPSAPLAQAAPTPPPIARSGSHDPSWRFVPPPPQAQPGPDDAMDTYAAEEPSTPPAPRPSSPPSTSASTSFVPPPPPASAPSFDDSSMETFAAEEPAAAAPVSPVPSSPGPFIPPPPAQPPSFDDASMETYAAEEPASPPAPAALPPPVEAVARFVPPPPSQLQPTEDDSMETYAAEVAPPVNLPPTTVAPVPQPDAEEDYDVTMKAAPPTPPLAPEPTEAEAVAESAPAIEPPILPVVEEALPVAVEESAAVAAAPIDGEAFVPIAASEPVAAESEPILPEPPPVDVAAPARFIPPPPSRPVIPEEETMATVAEEVPPPPLPIVPPPVREEPPSFRPAAAAGTPPPLSPPPAPPQAPSVSRPPAELPPIAPNLEESVTFPTALREARAIAEKTPQARNVPPTEVRLPQSYQVARASFPWIWVVIPVALMLVGVFAWFVLKEDDDTPKKTEVPEATPIAQTPAPATPIPATPLPATPTPVPTTPRPLGRAVQITDLAALADRSVNESLLLTGSFRVSSATASAAGRPGHSIMRPTDAKLSGKVRVMVTHRPPAMEPAEASTITITPASRYFILAVRKGGDDQLNVEVEQR